MTALRERANRISMEPNLPLSKSRFPPWPSNAGSWRGSRRCSPAPAAPAPTSNAWRRWLSNIAEVYLPLRSVASLRPISDRESPLVMQRTASDQSGVSDSQCRSTAGAPKRSGLCLPVPRTCQTYRQAGPGRVWKNWHPTLRDRSRAVPSAAGCFIPNSRTRGLSSSASTTPRMAVSRWERNTGSAKKNSANWNAFRRALWMF